MPPSPRANHPAAAAAARRGGLPHMVDPAVRRPAEVDQGARAAWRRGRQIMLVAQKPPARTNQPDDMFEVGCVSGILQMLKAARRHGEGAGRGAAPRQHDTRSATTANASSPRSRRCRTGRHQTRGRGGAAPRGGAAVRPVREAEQEDPARDPDLHRRHRRRQALADTIAAHLPLKLENKQGEGPGETRSTSASSCSYELEARSTSCRSKRSIRGRVKRQMEKTPARVLPERAVKAIQKELGDGRGRAPTWRNSKEDHRRQDARRRRARRPKRAEEAQADVADVAEATVVRNYIDTLVSLPWARRPRSSTTSTCRGEVLDEDHYGLEKVRTASSNTSRCSSASTR